MNPSVVALTIAYALLGLLLLSLQLRSAWPWPVKALAIGTALPLLIVTFVHLQALTGWPSTAPLPPLFRLHAALVEEPSNDGSETGRIYLWLTPSTTPSADPASDRVPPAAGRPPRAYALPYNRELHGEVEAMREALRQGDMVAGRHESGTALARRFGRQGGSIDLYAPPPPPMPSKDG
jgi:hypothetical protein